MHIRSLFFVFSIIAILCGCSNKKRSYTDSYVRPPSMVFSKEDTTQINQLANSFVEYINKGDISSASASLYYLDKGSVVELPLKKRQQFEEMLANIPFSGCQLKSFHLEGAKDNKIGVAIKITPDADVANNKGIITLVLNPVQVEGKWYLTLRDEYAEGISHDNN